VDDTNPENGFCSVGVTTERRKTGMFAATIQKVDKVIPVTPVSNYDLRYQGKDDCPRYFLPQKDQVRDGCT
jgi:hypothetical protein